MDRGSKIVSYIFAIVIVASFTTSTCMGIETKPEEAAKPSAAALEFLRARCNTVWHANECYDSLLPHAESFNGNYIKVAAAATDIFVSHLEGLLGELRHLNSTTTEYTVGGCIKFADASLNLSKEWSAKLKRLEAVRDGKLDEKAKGYATKWVEKVANKFGECTMDLGNVPAEMVPHEQIALYFAYITQGLVNGIPLTSAAAPASA